MVGEPIVDREHDDVQWWLREHGPKLVLLARQWVDCHADAEDVVQEAFVRFWKIRDSARDPVAFLYACVRNASRNWQRGVARRKEHERKSAAEPLFADPDGELVARERAEQVQAALCALPDEQREVVVLKIWGGLTFQAVSDVLLIPAGTAQSRYRYAIQAMRRQLASKPVTGEQHPIPSKSEDSDG